MNEINKLLTYTKELLEEYKKYIKANYEHWNNPELELDKIKFVLDTVYEMLGGSF